MSTGAWTFRPIQLRRILKAAKEAGVSVRVEIERDKLVVTTIDGKASELVNPWDVEASQLRLRREVNDAAS